MNDSQRVFVYYNLHKHLWSLRDVKTRLVCDHRDLVVLKNCRFKVSEAGRQRVLREQRKNVHAGVEGYLIGNSETFPLDFSREITYNPYKYETFVVRKTLEPIYQANFVLMKNRKVYCA